MAVGDHIDALDSGNRFDVIEGFKRFDRNADNDVGIGPWRVLGHVTGAVALVAGVHPVGPKYPNVQYLQDLRSTVFPSLALNFTLSCSILTPW